MGSDKLTPLLDLGPDLLSELERSERGIGGEALGSGRRVHMPHTLCTQSPQPQDLGRWPSRQEPGTWRLYRGSCRWS